MEDLKKICLDLLDITGAIPGVDLLKLIQYSHPNLNVEAIQLQTVLSQLTNAGHVKHSNVYSKVSTNEQIDSLVNALNNMSTTLSGYQPSDNQEQDQNIAEQVTVKSSSDPSKEYLVDVTNQNCTCPDYKYRGGPCKHIQKVSKKRVKVITRKKEDLKQVKKADSSNIVEVPSFNSSGEVYKVDVTNTTCTCPDYKYRGGPNYLCKHIKQLVVNPELYDLDPSDLVEIATMIAAQ